MNEKIFLIVAIILVSLTFVTNAQAEYLNFPVIRFTDINYEPSPARAGDYIDLFITVENEGLETAENLNVDFIPEYPFSLDPNQNTTKIFVKLNGLDSRVVYYKVRVDSSAVSGNNKLKLRYWEGTNKNPTSYVTTSLDIFVESSSSLVVSEVTPTTLNPGSQTEVVFKLSNVGNSAIRNLLFEWDEPNNLILPIGSDNRKYIPLIDIGENLDVKFRIMADPNLAPGVYPLTLKLTHDNGNSTSTKVGMIVGGGTDFDIGVESVGGEMSLSISNVGVNNAESVSVKLGSETEILGNLNKGDFTLATFSNPRPIPTDDAGITGQVVGNRFRGQDNQSESRSMVVEISYTDTTGQRQTVTKELSPSQLTSGFTRGSQDTNNFEGGFPSERFVGGRGGDSSNTLIIIVVIVIVIAGGFYFYRKRRKVEDEI